MLFDGNRHATEVPFIIKPGCFDKFGVVRLRLRFGRPRVEFRDEGRSPELGEIREKNCARIGGQQRQRLLTL